MGELGKTCEHGSLARQCPVCELLADLDRLEQLLAKERDAFGKKETELMSENAKLKVNLTEAKQINALNAQSIEWGRASVAKYREALEKISKKHDDFGNDAYGDPIGCCECGGTGIAKEALREEPMRAILEFNLPEDAGEHMMALHGADWAFIVQHLAENMRSKLKYSEMKTETQQMLEEISAELYKEIKDMGLTLP